MHELSLASNIINIVSRELKARSISFDKLKTVKIVVGKLMQVVPDSLHYALEITGKDIGFSEACYEIAVKPVELACNDCLERFVVAEFDMRCPKCASDSVNVIGGREFLIEKITINDD